MLKIFVLVLIIVRIQGLCPDLCECTSSYVANCASTSLTRIPSDRFNLYMQNLDISDNILASLNKTSLRDMGVVSLSELNASRNYINSIHEEAFVGQSRLQLVDLSGNNLTYIEPRTFVSNPFLEWLSLSNNKLLDLHEKGNFLISGSLRVLHLSACNIEHIPPETFKKLPNLEELYVSYNKIETLDPLQGAGRLAILDLSNNHLRALDSNIFTASPHLINFDLSYNWLHALNVEIMPQLARVTNSSGLNGNPWECDCVMFNTTYSWCHDNRLDIRLTCFNPAKFKGRSWTVYDKEGCDDQVEEIQTNDDKLPTMRRHANYELRSQSMLFPVQNKQHDVSFHFNYFYSTIVLIVLCVCLIGVAVSLWYYTTSNPLMRTGPAQTDTERGHLAS